MVQWRDDIAQFIAEALGPAKVKEVHIDEEEKTADVVVSEHQLSLAIGKEGQNARLAARLSGYKVDIRSDVEPQDEESEEAAVSSDVEASEVAPGDEGDRPDGSEGEDAVAADPGGDLDTVEDDEDAVEEESEESSDESE